MPITSRFAAAAARAYGMFSNLARAVDPFFNYVTALLHGDGTNGAQNNTFLDSSTNNFTITRNGNTTQGTFSPFSQTGWSNYFDGTGDYLSATSNAAFGMGSGDYTIECWLYLTGTPTYHGIYSTTGTTSSDIQIQLQNRLLRLSSYTAQIAIANAGTEVPLNQWTHVAFCRSGSTVRLFNNGIQVGSATDSTTWATGAIQIGQVFGLYPLNGYMSNLRVVKGTAVYTSNFTVPTTPLTAITNTSLLTCQDNRFIDNSSNAFALTRTGDVSVQAFSPFNPTSAWSASSNGGSGYFDGSGDRLTAANNAALQFGTGNYTIEFWWYTTTNALMRPIGTGATEVGTWCIIQYANGTFDVVQDTSASFASPIAYTINTWQHIAIVRSGTTLSCFVNGSRKATTTNSYNFNAAVSFFLGYSDAATSQAFTGYISDVRLVKGTAVYDPTLTTLTVPTAPLTAITNTSLLLNYTNAGIYDNAAVGDYETVGNAQVSTSVYKYGTGSVYFDGAGDYLTIPYGQSQNFGTGDFTIEGWFYLNSLANSYYVLGGTWSGATSDEWLIQVQNNGSLRFLTTADTAFYATGLIKTGTWYHFAASRSAGVIKAYINGTAFATITNANSIGSVSKTLNIGQQPGGTWPWNGYLDDWRVTKGIGRYPYNFTPPAAALPNIGGTVTLTADPYYNYTTLLLPGNGTNGAQNNTFLDSSSNAFTITRNGNTTQGNFSPFSQTGWGNYFDGTANGYISTPATTDLDLSADFTVQAWVYPTANGQSSNSEIISRGAPTTTDGWRLIFPSGTTQPCFTVNYAGTGNSANSIQSSVNVPLNYWTHIAVTRSGNTAKIYINGNLDTTNASFTTAPTTNGSDVVYVGRGSYDTTNRQFTGYVSNASVIKGTALTTFNTTTPLSTSTSGQSLLTCTANRFLDANTATTAKAITAGSGASVQAFSPFAPTAAWSASTNGGSGYFDGSGDYLVLPSSSNLAFGTGDFSVEGWVYLTSLGSNANIYSNATANDTEFAFTYLTTGVIRFSGWNTVFVASGSGAVTTNQWLHVVACRSGTTGSIFVNGSRVATATVTNNFSGTTAFGVGASGAGAGPITGYISSFRVLKGSSAYDATQTTLTIPTAPLTAITNTQFLMSATNGGIVDATAKNDLETVGNAQISTTQSKFGGSSMYFDGTGDYLYGKNTRLMDIGSGDFTIEGWLYPTTSGTTRAIVAQFNTNGTGPGWTSYLKTTNVIEFYGGSGTITVTGTGTVSANAWSHFAICRYGSTITIYVNGIAGGTGTNSSFSDDTTGPVEVGARGGAGAIPFTGYIDDLRITKGIARYTSNFTPPTSAFLLQ